MKVFARAKYLYDMAVDANVPVTPCLAPVVWYLEPVLGRLVAQQAPNVQYGSQHVQCSAVLALHVLLPCRKMTGVQQINQ
jgi:hypothetical protein